MLLMSPQETLCSPSLSFMFEWGQDRGQEFLLLAPWWLDKCFVSARGVSRDKAARGREMLEKLEKSLEVVGFSLRI